MFVAFLESKTAGAKDVGIADTLIQTAGLKGIYSSYTLIQTAGGKQQSVIITVQGITFLTLIGATMLKAKILLQRRGSS